jgi:hypothetical protein
MRFMGVSSFTGCTFLHSQHELERFLDMACRRDAKSMPKVGIARIFLRRRRFSNGSWVVPGISLS